MSTKKYIYWHDELNQKEGEKPKPRLNEDGSKQFANIHLLVGYCPISTAFISEMIEQIRMDFPFIKPEDVEFSKITRSNCVEGFTLAKWGGYLEKKDYEGWFAAKNCDYYWV